MAVKRHKNPAAEEDFKAPRGALNTSLQDELLFVPFVAKILRP